MKPALLLFILVFLTSSCALKKQIYVEHQDVAGILAVIGIPEWTVDNEIENIVSGIVKILHKNFSIDETFVILGDDKSKFFNAILSKMKQAGFKVHPYNPLLAEQNSNHLVVKYTFTVTSNNLLATADVALLRLWVGENFQISKAFNSTVNGLNNKTGFSVLLR